MLFELDDADPRAAVRLAQAEVTSAEATLRQRRSSSPVLKVRATTTPSAATMWITPACSAMLPALRWNRRKPGWKPQRDAGVHAHHVTDCRARGAQQLPRLAASQPASGVLVDVVQLIRSGIALR